MKQTGEKADLVIQDRNRDKNGCQGTLVCRIFIILAILSSGISLYCQGSENSYQYALIEAVKQKNLGNIPGAIALYNIVIDEDDSVAVAYYELGTLHILTQEIEMAKTYLKRAWELAPHNKWYMDAYVDVLTFNKEFRKAEVILNAYLDEKGREPEFEFKLANIYFVASEYRKAAKTLNRIEKTFGVSERIILLKANVYESWDKPGKAVEEIEKLLDYFPESVEFRIAAAEISKKAGNDEAAVRFYEDAYRIDSTNVFAITNLTDYYQGRKDFSRSLYYMNKSFQSEQIDYERKREILGYYLNDEFFQNNYNQEIEELVKTLLLKYKDKRDIRLIATDYYIRMRDYHSAFEAVFPVLKKNENSFQVWRQGVLLASATQKKEELLVLTTSAVEIFPDSIEFLYLKGVAEYENEKYADVIHSFDDHFLQKADDAMAIEALTLKGEAYHKLQLYHESDSLFELVLSLDPENYLVLNNFSYYLALRGDRLEEAKQWSWRAIQANPDNATFLDTYAWILYSMGDFEDAERYINKAIEKGGGNDPDIMEHAGDIQIAVGSSIIAKSFYEKAIILGGDQERIQAKIDALESDEN